MAIPVRPLGAHSAAGGWLDPIAELLAHRTVLQKKQLPDSAMHHPTSPLRASRTRDAKPRRSKTVIERLESRIAPAFTGAVSGNSATFTDGAGASTSLTIFAAGSVLHHNQPFTAATAGAFNSDIDFDNTQSGDQSISTASTYALTINAGDGNDTITLGTSSAPASAFGSGGTINVNGESAQDSLTIDDSQALTGRVFTVGAASIILAANVKINFQTLESVSVNAGLGSDTFSISGGDSTVAYLLDGGGGGGSDGLSIQRDASDFTLSNSSFSYTQAGSTPVFGLVSVETANLTGGGGANVFNVSGWSGTAALDGANTGADQFNITFNGSGTGTVNVTAGIGVDALVANGTANSDSFTLIPGKISLGLETINYTGPIDSITIDGKGGNDPVSLSLLTPIASATTSFTYVGGGQSGDVLSFTGTGGQTATWNAGAADAGSVTVSGGTYNYSTASGGLSFNSLASVSLVTAAGSDNYTLAGPTSTLSGLGQKAVLALVPSLSVNFGNGDGPSGSVADTFTVNGIPAGVTSLDVKLGSGPDQLNITGVTTLAGITFTANGGATGPDTINFSGDVSVGLSDNALGIVGGLISIAEFENAVLTGGGSGNQYTVTGWTGTGSIDGLGGTDTLVATSDVAAIGLTDAAFTRTGLGTFTLASIESATLAGGPGVNAFTISTFTGNASVTGGGGSDSLTLTAATGLTVTLLDDTSSTITYGNSTITANAIGSFTLHGNGLGLIGDTQASAIWSPSATGNAGGGSLDLLENAIHRLVTYDGALASVTDLSTLTLQTPAGPDAITLGSDGNGFATIGGSVGGNALSTTIQDVQNLVLDLGASDAVGGAVDTLTINALSGESALGSLSLKTGEGDDVITFPSTITSLNLPFPSGGVSVDAGAGTDQIVANSPSTPMALTKPGSSGSLSYGGASGLSFAGVERFDLTARSLALTGTDAETVAWTPGRDAVLNTALGAYAGSLAAPNSFFGTVVYHLDPSGMPLTLSHLYTLNLATQAGADTFTLDAGSSNGEVTLSGTAGSNGDAHGATLSNVVILGVDFGTNDAAATADKLTVKTLAAASLTTLTVTTGNGDDTLELDAALTSFALGSNPGEGFSFDGGAGSDTIKATSSTALNLSATTLSTGNGGALAHANTEHFNLDGGVSGQVNYTGDGTEAFAWSPDGALTGQGMAAFGSKDLIYKGQLGIFTTASLTLNTPAGADAFTLGASLTLGQIDGTVAGSIAHHAIFNGVPTVTIDLGIGDGAAATADTLTVSSLNAPSLVAFTAKTGAGDDKLTLTVTNLRNSTWDAGTGHDTLEATADLSMEISSTGLFYSDNVNHTSLFGSLVLTGSAVEVANLTGGGNGNLFRFNGWAGSATVKAGAGHDTIDLRGGFSGTGSFQGEADDDTFFLQGDLASITTRAFAGGLGGASLDGGSGNDTLQAQTNLDLTLTDALLTRTIPKTKNTPAQSISNTLTGFEHAILGGAASPNLFDARQFTGVADLSGEGGIDNLIGSKGGGVLYGFHANATVPETKSNLYTRDNFFASPGNTTDLIHATKKAGNILSFRYSPTAVNYTIPNAVGGTAAVGGGLNIQLVEGTITAVEGSVFGDRLTGNKQTNFLIGGKGNDVLRAVGFDYLYGGPGNDRLLGTTPFRFQNTNYPIPNSAGVTAVRYPAPFPRPESSLEAIAAVIAQA